MVLFLFSKGKAITLTFLAGVGRVGDLGMEILGQI